MLNRERITLIVMGVALCAQGLIIYRLKNPVEPPLPELVAPFEYPSDDPREIYLEGMKLFSEQGHAEAKKYFKYIYNKTGDGLFFFALAWIDYRARNLEAAKIRTEHLILIEPDESELKAFAYHLLGYLNYDDGLGEQALDSFQKAESLNIHFDRPKEIFRNRMGQALSLSLLEEFEGARETLLMAMDSISELPAEKRPSLGLFYQVSAFVEWKLRNYEKALRLEEACLSVYSRTHDFPNEVKSQLRLSYYWLRNGEFVKAEMLYEKAFITCDKLELDPPLESSVVGYLLDKCQNQPTAVTYSQLSNLIQQQGTPHQKKLFQDLDSWPCSIDPPWP